MAKPAYPATLNSSDPLASGLVGWWLLAEGTGTTAHDSSTTGTTGTLAADVSWTTGDGADPVLSFPADTGNSQNGVDLGNSSTLSPSSAATIAVRFRADSGLGGNWQTLIARGSVFIGWNWDLVLNGTTLSFFTNGSTATISCTKDAWHTALVTWDGTNTQIYLDGTAGTAGTATALGASNEVALGRGTSGSTVGVVGAPDGLGGLISWAAIWDRVLSSTERSELLSTPFQPFQSAGVTATLAVTLGDATLSASATFSAPTALAATLAPATLSATATFSTPSALAATLADATFAATATFAAPTALAATLGDATLAASASFVPAGGAVLAATLAPATLAATATFATATGLAAILAPATLAAQATFATASGLAATLAPATLVAHATYAAPSALAATLAPATLAATAVWAPPDPAALAATLGDAVLVATAHAAPPGQVTCALAAQLEDATLVATARCRWLPGDLIFITNFGKTIYPLMDWSVTTAYPMPDWTIKTRYPER